MRPFPVAPFRRSRQTLSGIYSTVGTRGDWNAGTTATPGFRSRPRYARKRNSNHSNWRSSECDHSSCPEGMEHVSYSIVPASSTLLLGSFIELSLQWRMRARVLC